MVFSSKEKGFACAVWVIARGCASVLLVAVHEYVSGAEGKRNPEPLDLFSQLL